MGSLYQPAVIEYRVNGKTRLGDGTRVKKDTLGAVRVEKRSPTWWGKWKDQNGEWQYEALSPQKARAEKMLTQRMAQVEMARVGLIDPFAAHKARPIAAHLDDFAADLKARNVTEAHARETVAKARATLAEAKVGTTADLKADAVRTAISRLRERGDARPELPPLPAGAVGFTRDELAEALGVNPQSIPRMLRRARLAGTGQGKARRYPLAVAEALAASTRGFSLETANHYLTAVKAFSAWLAGEGKRMAVDPLATLKKWNADTDRRRRRRALPEASFSRFIDSTAGGRVLRGLTGADRLALYTFAANTGLRAGELASLTPACFDLGARPPVVTVAAAYSKHRREDVVELRPDVAALMLAYLADRPRAEPVWPGGWSEDAAEMVQADLEAADLPYRDDAGRYFDFHSLRGQLATMLAVKGVHPRVAQAVLRHGNVELTMKHYTDASLLDLGGALEKLPPLPPAARPQKQQEDAG